MKVLLASWSVALIAGASPGLAPTHPAVAHGLLRDVMLLSNPSSPDTALDELGGVALIMGPTGIPTPSPEYVDTVERLYLDPLGFDGNAVSLTTPEHSGNTDVGLAEDEAAIVAAVDARIQDGGVSAEDPIWLFGYSQSTAAAALAAQHFHAEGIPSDYLHFVLIGDSASAHGGFLNAFLPSLPEWLRQWVEPMLPSFGIAESVGLTTPDYYPTDVYTISDDGYASWPENVAGNWGAVWTAVNGMFSSHAYYLGLTPDQIPAPDDPTFTDGLANYYTIDIADINGWDALVQAGENLGYLSQEFGEFLSNLF